MLSIIVFYSFILLVVIAVILINKNKKMDQIQNQPKPANDGGNVLPGSGQNNASRQIPNMPKEKSKYSALSILMAVILFGIVVMLGERLIFDLNRLLNPVIDKDYTSWQVMQNQYNGRRTYEYDMPRATIDSSVQNYKYDSAAAAPGTRLYYASTDQGRYMMYKLIIHAAVIIPLFILAFVTFYFKKDNIQIRPLLISFIAFAFWMMFHLLGETIKFVMDEYKNVAIYVILVVLMAVFGVLAYYSQIKHQKQDKVS